jgi:hypothetical protein
LPPSGKAMTIGEPQVGQSCFLKIWPMT